MMRWAATLVLLLAAQDPADKVRALVEKLGSDEIAAREEAFAELTRIGRAALPEMQRLLPSNSGDTKIRLQRAIEHVTAFGTPPLITLKAKDRPVREILAELQRQTGILFRFSAVPESAKSNVSADHAIVWKVVEDLCRARGDLMYRFQDDAIEIYPSKFRALPTVDVAGLRFIIDRFVWNENQFWQNGALLAPPGARVVKIGLKLDESVDDLGNDPMKEPWHQMEPIFDGFPVFPGSGKFVYPFWFNRLNGGTPALEAAKIVRCRGKIEVWLAGGERVLKSIRDPLAGPSVPEKDGIPSLGIKRWKVWEDMISLHVSATWDQPSVTFLDPRLGPRLILRLKDGTWKSPDYVNQDESWPDPKEIKRMDTIRRFHWPKGSEAITLDLIGPDPILKVEIPFDFRDIPLR